MGGHLARMELKIALQEWLKRIPKFSVKPGAQITYKPGGVVGPAPSDPGAGAPPTLNSLQVASPKPGRRPPAACGGRGRGRAGARADRGDAGGASLTRDGGTRLRGPKDERACNYIVYYLLGEIFHLYWPIKSSKRNKS